MYVIMQCVIKLFMGLNIILLISYLYFNIIFGVNNNQKIELKGIQVALNQILREIFCLNFNAHFKF